MRTGGVGTDAIGEAIAGRFSLLEQLGEGGAGIVYRAFNHTRRHDVALKVLRRQRADELYRFKQEFRSLAGLVHPNLVTLYELHAGERDWFFTMELVHGVDWLEHVRPFRGILGSLTPTPISDTDDERTATTGVAGQVAHATPPTDPREAVRRATLRHDRLRHAMIQTAEGIRRLHEDGKLHRDLKPSNVLVDRSGRAVVCDFGLVTARADKGDSRLAGTPAYMSPEQVEVEELTPATDWYSLGVMLFEALTGQRPFEGDRASVMRAKVDQDAPAEAAPRTVVR